MPADEIIAFKFVDAGRTVEFHSLQTCAVDNLPSTVTFALSARMSSRVASCGLLPSRKFSIWRSSLATESGIPAEI